MRTFWSVKKVLISLAAICTISIPIALWIALESRYKLDNTPPVWSPDGQTLLFSATSWSGKTEIYQIKVDRTKQKRLNFPIKKDSSDCTETFCLLS
ncbi:hypothetical protein [Microcoleus sp. herbarium14]|uniref:hypothetical protein n=1 Tax=Microcoleus sp. herbarium14 TaxID=3055439 RepID=UPI002FD11430